MTDYIDPHFIRALCKPPERRNLQVNSISIWRFPKHNLILQLVYNYIMRMRLHQYSIDYNILNTILWLYYSQRSQLSCNWVPKSILSWLILPFFSLSRRVAFHYAFALSTYKSLLQAPARRMKLSAETANWRPSACPRLKWYVFVDSRRTWVRTWVWYGHTLLLVYKQSWAVHFLSN